MVGTQYGTSMVLELLDNGEVWAPESLKNKIVNSDTYYNPPFYVRPLGLKHAKKKIEKTSITHMIWPSHISIAN